jgi:hypothetical protein
VAGQQDDFGVGEFFFGLLKNSQAVDVVHFQIGDDDIEFLTLDQLNAATACA